MAEQKTLKLNLNYPIYPALTTPEGALPKDKRAQACWYYYTLAQNQFDKVGTSTDHQFALYSDSLWLNKHYAKIARGVATLYQLDSPSEMFKFWPYVKTQCEIMNYPSPKQEYMSPNVIDTIN